MWQNLGNRETDEWIVIDLTDPKSWIWSQWWVQQASLPYRIPPNTQPLAVPAASEDEIKNKRIPSPIAAQQLLLSHLAEDQRFIPLEMVMQSVSGLADSRNFESRKMLLKTSDLEKFTCI